MIFLFCADPLNARSPDPAYAEEVAAATTLGIEHGCVSYEALVNDRDATAAVRRVAQRDARTLGLYRGWMLTPERYERLYEALAGRGIHLINDPSAYRHCHHLPESYSIIAPHTPRSVWLRTGPEVSFDAVMELLRPFGSAPVIVKDFVRSRKHEWAEACYIPGASDREAVERVVRRFLELQGDDLAEGLVFREFVRFEPLGTHSKSGMPLTREYRLLFLDGALLTAMPCWEEGDYAAALPPPDLFADVARAVRSRFFTMDVARRLDGDWMIVELGDAQVAGLPESADVLGFYQALWECSPSVS